jgi:hypothetical protein
MAASHDEREKPEEGSMKRALLAVSLMTTLGLCPALFAADEKPAGDKDVVTAKGQKSRGDAKDENIKSKSDVNKASAPAPAPAEKGGEKSRGGSCQVHFDNATPWKIQIYVDGQYQGMVGAYGDATEWYYGTAGTLYGKADFDDGSSLTWGPQRAICVNGHFRYRLQ